MHSIQMLDANQNYIQYLRDYILQGYLGTLDQRFSYSLTSSLLERIHEIISRLQVLIYLYLSLLIVIENIFAKDSATIFHISEGSVRQRVWETLHYMMI